VRSWKELLGPKFTGKITAYDPRSGGPGQAAAAYVAQQFGTDFLTELYVGQKTVYTRGGRQLVEWVVRGNYAVALGSVQLDIENFRARGIKNLYVPQLEDGPGSVVGGFSVLKQPVGAPHPNAATIFINWYASQPGQTVYTRVMLEPSMRADVDVPSVPDYTKPKPGLAYLDQYQGDWYVNKRPQLDKAITQALGGP
jgi:ABC-type Fe3+ transport system substrate-binding protein